MQKHCSIQILGIKKATESNFKRNSIAYEIINYYAMCFDRMHSCDKYLCAKCDP